MAFPTEELANAWNSEAGRGTINELMEWSQVPAGIRQPLLAGLGADEATDYRMFPFSTVADIDELIRDLRVGDPERGLNIGEKGSIRLMFNAIRCAAGTLENPAPRTPPQTVVQTAPSQELTATSANAVA